MPSFKEYQNFLTCCENDEQLNLFLEKMQKNIDEQKMQNLLSMIEKLFLFEKKITIHCQKQLRIFLCNLISQERFSREILQLMITTSFAVGKIDFWKQLPDQPGFPAEIRIWIKMIKMK